MRIRSVFLLWLVGFILLTLVACVKTPTPETEVHSPISTPVSLADSPLPTPAVWDFGAGRLLFISDRENSDLHWYSMALDGGDVQAMPFPGDMQIVELKWVPPLHAFAAVLRIDGGENLYLIDGFGNILRQLTTSPDNKDSAAYSKEADAFAFVCLGKDLDICAVPASGGEIITVFSSFARETSPVWSPDGKKLLFISNHSGVPDVWHVDADGQNPVNLTQTGQPHGEPSWSPDGKKILFTSQRDFNWEVYVMGMDGNNSINLTNHPARDIGPQWSPDGAYIAFRSDRTGDDDIYVMKSDATDLVNLTNTSSVSEVVYSWSPDGSQIFYVSAVSGNMDIYVVKRDGSDTTNLTNNPANDVGVQWIH